MLNTLVITQLQAEEDTMRKNIEDVKLLKWMRKSAAKADSLYKPGPYWDPIAKNAFLQLRRKGLRSFRGQGNSSALSFSDFVIADISLAPGRFRNLKSIWLKLPIVKQTLAAQVAITESHIRDSLRFEAALYQTSARAAELVTRYQLADLPTLIGNPRRTFVFDGAELSVHYVKMLDAIDQIAAGLGNIPPRVLEIGGGFGATAHLLIERFDVRKYLYVDISPSLYVGTQYLKKIFGDSVVSAEEIGTTSFNFGNDDQLEVVCILPHQLQQFRGELELLWNSHSFVEMPAETVANYANLSRNILSDANGSVALVTYEPTDALKTLDPQRLPKLFGLDAKTWKSVAPNGLDSNRFFLMRM